MRTARRRSPRSSCPIRELIVPRQGLMTAHPAAHLLGRDWHTLSSEEVLAHLGSDAERGLEAEEARRRLERVGPNRVGEQPETPLWRLALAQFCSLVVVLLLAAAVVAGALGERAEALAILAALVLNAAIGFGSEWRARVSLARHSEPKPMAALSTRAARMAKASARSPNAPATTAAASRSTTTRLQNWASASRQSGVSGCSPTRFGPTRSRRRRASSASSPRSASLPRWARTSSLERVCQSRPRRWAA